jgi:hypothetical protein
MKEVSISDTAAAVTSLNQARLWEQIDFVIGGAFLGTFADAGLG